MDLNAIRKILVIKLRHHGDVLLTTPVFQTLKRQFPQAQIDAYIYKDTYPMLQGLSSITDFHLYDKGWKKKGLWHRYIQEAKLLRGIRKAGYDLTINLTEGDRGAIASILSKASVRVGADPKNTGMLGKAKCYTHLAQEIPGMRHTVEMNLDILRPLQIQSSVEDRHLQFMLPEQAEANVSKLLEGTQEYFLCHPVSRWMFKCWPADKVSQAILHIYEKHQIPFVLTAAPVTHELDFNKQVMRHLPKEAYIDLSGKVTLKELGVLIRDAKVFLTVDSVPMHMAAVFKTPMVAIFGPTSEKRWAPWQHSNCQIVYQQMPCRPCYKPGCNSSHRSECLESLEVNHVLDAFDRLRR